MPRLVVVVQEGLDEISRSIEKVGYKVVDIDNTTEIIDAIIYSSSNMGVDSGNFNDDPRISGSNGFVVMINADENSEDEILSRLENIK